MAAIIRLFSRRKKKDKLDSAERCLYEGHSPAHDSSGRSKTRKNDIECKVIHLDGQEMTTFLPKKALGRQLYDRVFTNFDFTQEFDYFGLQYMDTANIAQWLDPTKKIKRQLSIGPPYTLHLKVRFFSSEPQNLRDELTRYLFVLQLKKDILEGKLKCDLELGAELAALSMQAEFGDFDSETHTPAFISQFRFMPDHLQTEDFEISVMDYYKDLTNRNITPAVADKSYLDKARYLADYGVDMHRVTGKDSRVYLLGLTPTGILVYDNDQKIGFFFWPWIITIGFNKNKLKIIVAEKDDETDVTRDHSFVFALVDPRACKHLWKCCVECHSFFRLVSNNQRPVGRSGKLLRLQSRFYSSYRTEFEMRNANYGSSHRRSSRFQRVPSRRFSSRASFEKSEAIRKIGSSGDEVKSKAVQRAERKAETLRRLEQSEDTADAGTSPKPITSVSSANAKRDSGRLSGGDFPKESTSSTVSSSSKQHKQIVSIEAKVEPPPKVSVTAIVKPSVPSSGSSTSSVSSHEPEAVLERGSAPTKNSVDDSVFEDSKARLVPSHSSMTSAASPGRSSGSSSVNSPHASSGVPSKSGFKPTRLQEESTDEESRRPSSDCVFTDSLERNGSQAGSQIPILSRPAARTGMTKELGIVTGVPQASVQPQVSPTGPSPSPLRQVPPSTTTGSRIPKMTAAAPSSATLPSQAPVTAQTSGIPQPRRTSIPTTTTATASVAAPRPTAPGMSRIPSLQQTSGAKPQRTASAASSSSSSSSSSSASSASPPPKTEELEKVEKKEQPAPPPTKIPTLPRTVRPEIPRSKSDVKPQFQVETSFSSSVSTSHKLSQGNSRVSSRPAIIDSSVVIVKRDAKSSPEPTHQQPNGKSTVSRNHSTMKETISTTV